MLDRGNIFEERRRKLHNLAYRLLGSAADADDVVQDVYIRWHESELIDLRSPDAWLTTVLTRACIDRLRARDRERETYLGDWLPEPFLVSDPSSPDRRLDLDADLSMALLLVLERLSPDERTVFLLHDVFGHRHHEIAAVIGKTAPTCRQLLHRARTSVRTHRPRFRVHNDLFKRLVPQFLDALRSDDHAILMTLMSEDARLISDSGGRVRATLKIIHGNKRIARLLIGLRRKRLGRTIEKPMLINNDPGVASYVDDRPVSVLWFEVKKQKITTVYRILNPDKLKRVPAMANTKQDTPVELRESAYGL